MEALIAKQMLSLQYLIKYGSTKLFLHIFLDWDIIALWKGYQETSSLLWKTKKNKA